MQTGSLNGRIALVSLLTILLMPHTLADDSIFTNSQYPNDDYNSSSGGSLGDPSAEPFGNLLGSNSPKIDSNWAIDSAGLKLNSNLQDGNPKSLLMADASIPCPNRRGKRSQNEQTYCKSPYSGTITAPTPEAQEGETGGEDKAPEENQAPDDWQGSRPWPKLDESSGQNILWMQLRSARGVEPEGNLRVCNKNGGMYPICYPYKYPGVPPLVDPAPIVEPCRLCKWKFLCACFTVFIHRKIDLKALIFSIIGKIFRRGAKWPV